MRLIGLILIAASAPELCPAPQSLSVDEKHEFVLLADTPIVVADDVTETERAAFDALFETIGFTLPIRRASEQRGNAPAIYAGEPGRHAALEGRKTKKFMANNEVNASQGYRLTIDNKAVVVAGSDQAGTFNGLQTLIQIAGEGIELPCLEIRDFPDLQWRGAYIEGPATREELRRMAALKCNLAVFASDDFYAFSGEAGEIWKRVFEEARALHIEPVPLIHTLANAGPLVAMDAVTAEGRVAVEQVVLDGDDWVALSKRNVIATATSPVRVQVSGHVCRLKTDYALDPGTLEVPFPRNAAPWLIRRIPGGAIPDGAAVTVTCLYVPAGTAGCCPSAPETREVLRRVVRGIVDTLHPRLIHIDHGSIERLNQCLRCRDRGTTNAAVFAGSVKMIDDIAKESAPGIRVMLWADAIDPSQDAALHDLRDAGALLPRDVILALRLTDTRPGYGRRIEQSIAWCRGLGLAYVGAPGADPSNVYAWCERLANAETGALGIMYTGGVIPTGAFALAMDKSWSSAVPRSAWPEALNAYFGTALWEPGYPDVADALAAHVNRNTLTGVPPQDQYGAFKDYVKPLRRGFPELEAGIDLVDGVYRNLVSYVELEAAFGEDRPMTVLQDLAKLVELHQTIDPEMDEARAGRIVETVEGKRLFVPSTILFGRHLLPYRPMRLPEGCTVLEIPVAPEYTDAEGSAAAAYDFLAAPGAICRVDFETVGTAALDVEYSEDGKAFTMAQQWTSQARGGVAGPAFLARPFRARFLRVTAHAPAERAVLRNTRVFAFKPAPRTVCTYARVDPKPADSFDAIAWPEEGKADAFVRADEAAFAEAQTTVRACRTRVGLFIGATAHEPRMRTLVAEHTERDAPLWDEESFEVLVQTEKGDLFRFAVNPLGTRFDSCGWDAGWDGAWDATVGRHDTAWSAVVVIPFDTLGVKPGTGAAWRVNFVRNRRNVRTERSCWSPADDPRRTTDFGVMAFR